MALRTKLSFAARALAAVLLLTAALFVWVQSQGLARAEAPGPSISAVRLVHVIDGETIKDLRSNTVYRLANVDTAAQTSEARCAAERRLGDRAAATTGALLSRARQLDVLPTGQTDALGQPTAYVVADGRDVGEALVARGFGRPQRDNGHPWCDADGNLIF